MRIFDLVFTRLKNNIETNLHDEGRQAEALHFDLLQIYILFGYILTAFEGTSGREDMFYH